MKYATSDYDATIANLAHPLHSSSMTVLQCIGWLDEMEKKRVVFLYNIPRPYQHHFDAIGHEIRPHLEEIFSVAYGISHTVFNIHFSGWLHKNINPVNIILMPNPMQVGKYEEFSGHFFIPYLKGIKFSRSINGESGRLAAKDRENNFYRHPDRQGLPQTNAIFQPIHDIYALGVIFLEIGRSLKLNTDLSDFKKRFKEGKKKQNRQRQRALIIGFQE